MGYNSSLEQDISLLLSHNRLVAWENTGLPILLRKARKINFMFR